MAEIREVSGAAEIGTVAALARVIWGEHYAPITGMAQVEYMLERFQSVAAISEQIASGGYRYFLVSSNGEDLGYMALVPEGEGPAMKLSKFYVRADARGSGLGRAMLEHAERLCRGGGFKLLWLTVNRNNAGSIAAYGRLGFENAGPLVTDIGGGFVMDDYRLEKRLG
jgi:GNAT superfamily N-acetyltransferase